MDGSDPDFVAERKIWSDWTPPPPPPKWFQRSQYTGTGEARENPIPSSQVANRFRSTEELRYLLRSLERHAPWLRRIHLVTNGQVPAWLDLSNPRLRLVTHAEIFLESDCLPTFNSHAIELNLARIPGLSEEFIYSNDDTFLARPISIADFKDDDGRYFMFAEPKKTLAVAMSDRSLIGHVWAFNHNMLIDYYGRKKGRRMFAHTPQMYARRHLEMLRALWHDEINQTIRHRFRTPFDAQQRILYMHYLAEGGLDAILRRKAAPPLGVMTDLPSTEYGFLRFGDDRFDYVTDMRNALLGLPKFLCVNDEINTGDDARDGILKDVLRELLAGLFPNPSPFEKPDPVAPVALPPARPLPQIAALNLLNLRLVPPVEGMMPSLQRAGQDPETGRPLAIGSQLVALPVDGILRLLPAAPPPSSIPVSQGQGGEAGGPNDAVAETELWLDLAVHPAASEQHPERGEPPVFRISIPVSIAPDRPVLVSALHDRIRDRLVLAGQLEDMVVPILVDPSSDGRAVMLNAAATIRRGEASEDRIVQLDVASMAGGRSGAGQLAAYPGGAATERPEAAGMAHESAGAGGGRRTPGAAVGTASPVWPLRRDRGDWDHADNPFPVPDDGAFSPIPGASGSGRPYAGRGGKAGQSGAERDALPATLW